MRSLDIIYRAAAGARARLLVLSGGARAADPDTLIFGLAYLLLVPLFLCPLLVTPLLPGLDLPFHLSMVDMLSKAGRPDSPYQAYYEALPSFAPYTTHYLALWGLSKLFLITTAHKIIIGAYVAALPLAMASLLAACGRSRIPALLAFPVAYNLTLHYGFVSFAISLPALLVLLGQLAKLLLAPHRAMRPRSSSDLSGFAESRRFALRGHFALGGHFVAVAAAAVLLYLCHLQAFLYGVCAAVAFAVFSSVSLRRRLLGLVALAPAVAALAWWQIAGQGPAAATPLKTSVINALLALKRARLVDLDGGRRPLLGELAARLLDIESHALRGFTDHIDVRACRILIALLAMYFVLGLTGWLFPQTAPAVRGRMRLAGWVAFLGAVAAFLALPHHLPAYDLMTFYPRFAPLVMVTTPLIIPASLKRLSGGLRLLVAVPAMLFCAFYGRELIRHYRMYAVEIADFVAVLSKAEPGGKALGLVFDRQSRVMRVESAFVGLPNLYAASKPAPGSMTQLSYCGMRHMPCRQKQPTSTLPGPGPWVPNTFNPDLALPFYDYFFVRSPPAGAELFRKQSNKVALVAHHGTWWLYRRLPPPPFGAGASSISTGSR